MSTCRYCGKSLRWADTTNGSKMPLNPEPDPTGNVVIENGYARVLRASDPSNGRTRYKSHFATCEKYVRRPARR